MGSKRYVALAVVVVVVIAIAVTLAVVLTQSSDSSSSSQTSTGLHGAVASDSEVCSNIGADVMRDNGTAIDAAVATLICLGLIHPHSAGIGGGGYMLLYKQSTKTATYLDFRETAPGASTPDMFVNKTGESKKGGCSWRRAGCALVGWGCSCWAYEVDVFVNVGGELSRWVTNMMTGVSLSLGDQKMAIQAHIMLLLFLGKLAVAVPGEVLAMYNAWKTQGRLPWKRLFQPTIDLANNGFKIDKPLAVAISTTKNDIIKERGFKYVHFKARLRKCKYGYFNGIEPMALRYRCSSLTCKLKRLSPLSEIVGSILQSTLYRKSWVFSGCSGFLPQGKLTGWVRINIVRQVISQLF
jgi:hypothetical protein